MHATIQKPIDEITRNLDPDEQIFVVRPHEARIVVDPHKRAA